MKLWMALLLASSAAAETARIEDLSFIAGSWIVEHGSARIEEHWTPARAGTLLGVNRTIVDGKTVAFEFLRIEQRSDGIYYVAQPGGRAGTEFELTSLEGQSAVFENPEHDHPKVIRYRRDPDGSLRAEIAGEENGEARRAEFHYRPASP